MSDECVVEIVNFREHINKNLRGYATFRMPEVGIEIRDCRILEQPHGLWIAMPSKSYTKHDGTKGYQYQIDIIKPALKKAFQAAAIEAYKEYQPPDSDAPPAF